MKSVIIDGKLISIGDTLIGTKEAKRAGATAGRAVKVAAINKNGSSVSIGVADTNLNEGWHNLDGAISSGSGYWLDQRELLQYFKPQELQSLIEIKGDFSFRKKSLKGKRGKMLAKLPNCEESMIEFEEFVGGCSCDGLGKAGHCLVVPHKLLEFVKTKGK